MKVINLKPNGVGRYDDVSPFIVAAQTLDLKIMLPAVNGEFYLITEINGNKVKKLVQSDGVINLDGLSAGELRAEVKHFLKGELIKTYKIEPLLLKDVDGKFSAEPEVLALRREFGGLKETFIADRKAAEERAKSFELKAAEYEAEVKRMQSTIHALMLFAYADYCKNVYLGGESAEGFCKEFGFELTADEKKILCEVNKNEN